MVAMTSIEVADATAVALHAQAARVGVTLDAYVRRLAVFDSMRLHEDVLGEEYFEAAEAERHSD